MKFVTPKRVQFQINEILFCCSFAYASSCRGQDYIKYTMLPNSWERTLTQILKEDALSKYETYVAESHHKRKRKLMVTLSLNL